MSEQPMVPPCPSPETLGEFLDGALTGDRLEAVNRHLAVCEDCMDVMRTAGRFRSESLAPVVPMMPRRMLAVAAVVVIALALGGIAWMLRRHDSGGMRALIDAAPTTYRRVEPRLTGFRWAELRRVRASETLPPDPESLRLGGAAGEAMRRAESDSSPDALHSAGVAELLVQQPQRSIERLRDAARRDPNRAAAWSDLAAAYYTDAVQSGRASELPLALAAADRALRIEPGHAEALFNRALILERMGLHDDALPAWREYLGVEPSSPWSNEARQHEAALVKPRASLRDDLPALEAAAASGDRAKADRLLRAHPQEARRWFEGQTLGQWGDAVLAGDAATAAKKLAASRVAGELLKQANGDALLADEVAAIERSGNRLAAAHAKYFHGRLRFRDRDLAGGRRDLLEAAGMFARGQAPMALVSRLFAASAAFDDNRIDDAVSMLDALLPEIPAGHASLNAEVRAMRGRCAMYATRWSDAIDDFTAAAAIFGRLGEIANLALAEAALGDCWSGVGHDDEAWEHRVAAFGLLDAAEHRIGAIAAAARSELHDGRGESAEALLRVEIDEAKRGGKALLIADAYHRRALLRAKMRDVIGGLDDLRLANAFLAREPESGLRRNVENGCAIAAAVLARESDPRRSVSLLDEAMAFQRASGERLSMASILLERARSHRAAGDPAAARDDVDAGLQEIERESGGGILDTAASLAEESVDLSLARGDAGQTFACAERVHHRDARVRTAADVSRALPPGGALVEYVLIPKGVAAIVITPRGTRAIAIPADGAALRELIRRERDAIERRADARPAAAALHALLVAPLPIGDASSLVIVPDRDLQPIAWAALYDETRREYLIERREITISSSASAWMRDRSSDRSPRGNRLLLVTDGGGGDLDVLDQVRAERSGLESLYADRVELQAPASEFVSRANECDVIHFAGHSRSLQPVPAHTLTRPRLAVLAACSTLDAAVGLIAAGVPQVVGTLWPVDDREASQLFGEFHRRLRAGADPASALRDAQLSMLHKGAPPAAWAGAELVEG